MDREEMKAALIARRERDGQSADCGFSSVPYVTISYNGMEMKEIKEYISTTLNAFFNRQINDLFITSKEITFSVHEVGGGERA